MILTLNSEAFYWAIRFSKKQINIRVELFIHKVNYPRLIMFDILLLRKTHDLVIMRHPDGNWVNVGAYRIQVFDKNTVGLWVSPGKHGRLIREKYFAEGKPCPVVISVGTDPLLFL